MKMLVIVIVVMDMKCYHCIVRYQYFNTSIMKVHQRIKEEKMNIEIVDRLNQIEIQEQVRFKGSLQNKGLFSRPNGPGPYY